MKTVKHLATLTVALCLLSACADNNPNPNYEVANCGVIKDPLQDITWLKAEVDYAIANKKAQKIIMYDYNNSKIYHYVMKDNRGVAFGNCNLSIAECACGGRGPSDKYTQIYNSVKNPVVLFEQK